MQKQRIIPLEGIKNLRDMGGYHSNDGRKIKWGALYRSGHYAELTPEGHNTLHQRRITSVVDFRSPSEKERQPAAWPIPIANAVGLKKLFDVLVDDNDGGAALFHCTAGKDRTGIAGALIMKALNISEDDIFADFLLTNEAVDIAATSAHYASLMSERAGRTIAPEAVHPLVGVEPDFLKAAFAIMAHEYGSVDTYLTDGMGLTPARREKLQARLLED